MYYICWILYAPDMFHNIKIFLVDFCSARQGMIPSSGSHGTRWIFLNGWFLKFILAEGSVHLSHKLKVRFWTLGFLEPRRAHPSHRVSATRKPGLSLNERHTDIFQKSVVTETQALSLFSYCGHPSIHNHLSQPLWDSDFSGFWTKILQSTKMSFSSAQYLWPVTLHYILGTSTPLLFTYFFELWSKSRAW